MSEQAPNRVIGGLVPRAAEPDLSRMRRANRDTAPGTPANAQPEQGSLRKKATGAAALRTVAEPTAETVAESEPARITTYLSAVIRDRAQAAYKSTSHLEGDKSWSAFVEKALLAETERREATYNEGRQYEGVKERLSAGRPLG